MTPWLPAALAPAHEGVYQRRHPGGAYSCWSADQWYGDAATPAAAAHADRPSAHQEALWRGLAIAPSEPCYQCRGHTVIDAGSEGEIDLIEECPAC